MQTNRAGHIRPSGVLLAATGMVVLCLLRPGLATAPSAGAVPAAPSAYVANNLSSSVTPVDTATNTPGTPITVGTRPTGIAITPDGTTAYVANFDSDTVTPIDTSTDTAGSPITVGTPPETIAITPDGTTAYVVNNGSNTVTPIDHRHQHRRHPDPGGHYSRRHRHHPRRDDRLRDQQQLFQHRDPHRPPPPTPPAPRSRWGPFPSPSPSPPTGRPPT